MPAEVGGPVQAVAGHVSVAIVRGSERIPFDDDRYRTIEGGDIVVSMTRL